jgi:hypothetical protein
MVMTETEVSLKAASFNKGGNRIIDGNGNINHIKEGPDKREIKVKITTGPTKVLSCSQSDCKGTPFFKLLNLKKTKRTEYITVNARHTNIIIIINTPYEF